MDISELMGLASRLRRTFPRHAEVLALCDEAERLALLKQEIRKPKRDRASYMRDWRAGICGEKNKTAVRA